MSSSSGFFGAWLSITPPKTYIIYMETQHFVFSCFFPFPTWAFFCFFPSHPYMPTKKFNGNSKGPQSRIPWSMGSWYESHQWGLLEKSLWRLFCVSSSADARSTRSRKFATRHLEEVCQRFFLFNLIFESNRADEYFFCEYIPWKLWVSSENGPSPKGTIVFQPSIFSCEPLVSERILWMDNDMFFESILILYAWAICWWYWYP